MFRRIILFAVVACIFLSCGIDDIVYLEHPKLIHRPTGHTDENKKYFEFETSDKTNFQSASGFFKGFEIYYRIYESKRDCESVISNMEKYTETNPSNSVNYLLSSYNYRLLAHSNHSYQVRPLIKAPSAVPLNNRSVKFRIENLNFFPNDFNVDGSTEGKTQRQNGEDFKDAKKGDYDVQSSAEPSSDSFYVAVFAAAYGFDTSFKTIYSDLISLGYVEIKKNTLISP